VRDGLNQAVYGLGGASLRVASDDPALLDELSLTFGRPLERGVPSTPFQLSASVQAVDVPDGFGRIALEAPDDDLLSPADFLLGLGTPDFPFTLLPAAPPWTRVALAGEVEPFFALNGRESRVRLASGWRKAVALLLLHRLMRVRRDAVFFHAASVAVAGLGVLLVGAKGAGKSTLALAVAARGHGLLGDEHACYRPSSREILAFRRPVGIKPGKRAAGVEEALRRLGVSPERDGMMRIDAETLFPGPAVAATPLAAVVFLEGFGAEPRLARLDPGRGDVGRLQIVASSLVNAPAARRVFELTQLLSSARVYRLFAGSPDATAEAVEQERRTWE
jgi:hypothetical protein